MSKKNILVAFLKAPLYLTLILASIVFFLGNFVFTNISDTITLTLIVTIFSLFISYLNLSLFGALLYWFYRKRNIPNHNFILISSLIIGIIESILFLYLEFIKIPGAAIYIISSVSVGYCLTKEIKRLEK